MRITKYKTLLNDKGLPELVKEASCNYSGANLTTPKSIVNMMNNVFQTSRQTEEFLYEICFTTKMKPIGVFEISHGTINSSVANPREILQKALICGAMQFVIIHNHPSGSSEPSSEDIAASNRLKEAGKLVGVDLIDSIIIGDNEYCSFKEEGRI